MVGDTWCAVTDPLRYHTRMSYAKSWLLIGTVWFIGIIIGVASAIGDCSSIGIDVFIVGAIDNVANVYNWTFSIFFFLLVILLPIGLVCVMYWKIFTEARQSGQRMRRNGSSPLLQSALNLTHPNGHRGSFGEHNRCASIMDIEALTMKIDGINERSKNHKEASTVKTIGTHQYRRHLDIPNVDRDKEVNTEHSLLPSTDTTDVAELSLHNPFWCYTKRDALKPSKIKREPRQLGALLENRMIPGQMRLVQSTPNLQKFTNVDSLHKIDCAINNQSSSNIQSSVTSPKAVSYMISIRHRLSNASSIFTYREESRAARISILVVIMLLFSYFPYGILVLLHGRVIFLANSSLLSILFLLIGSMSSPFIFAYRNRRVRRGVYRLFGINSKPNSHLQKQRMELRKGAQSIGNNSKHVRIHRNLSGSNISLSLIPYKFTGITGSGDTINHLGTHYGPFNDAKIDEHDEHSLESDRATKAKHQSDEDINNNHGVHKSYITTMPDDKKSFSMRALSKRSPPPSVVTAKTAKAAVVGDENATIGV